MANNLIPLQSFATHPRIGYEDNQARQFSLNSLRRKDKEEERQLQAQGELRQILSQGLPDDQTIAQLKIKGFPEVAFSYEKSVIERNEAIAKMDKAKRDALAAEIQQDSQDANAILQAPPEMQAELWERLSPGKPYPGPDQLNFILNRGMKILEQVQTENAKAKAVLDATEAGKPTALGGAFVSGGQQVQPYTQLNPLGTGYDIKTQTLGPVDVEQKTATPTFESQTYEDFLKEPELTKKYGANRVGFERWQSDNMRSRQAAQTVIVQTVDAEGKPITKIAPRTAGSEFPLAPTADMRNRGAAKQTITPILDSISELSEKINTGAGLLAKVQGAAARAAAKANYDDDVAEYESLISGFTPMVARAVGHVGVLTEQDIQSVKAMFPKPGDSKTLRDRKLARIKTILAAQGEVAPQSPANQDLKNLSTDELLQRLLK